MLLHNREFLLSWDNTCIALAIMEYDIVTVTSAKI